MSVKEKNSLCLPTGFRFAGLHCGIKESGLPDLALFVSERPCATAATYTQNEFRAASILRNEQLTPTQNVLAVLVNSGNANACTGGQGIDNNQEMARVVAKSLAIDEQQVLTLSTGIIGKVLPMGEVRSGIGILATELATEPGGFRSAADAILTSDNGPKTESVSFEIAGESYAIAGCAKGAGMIGPRMATMLSVIMTDVSIESGKLQAILSRAVERSFNRISVEGHTSTNDAVILMANGGGTAWNDGNADHEFEEQLTNVCLELAKKIPADGEGASHLIEIRVEGAQTDKEADQVARSVAQSALVKTAVAGNDPNWGRIMSAVGNAKAEIDVQSASLRINDILLFEEGKPVDFDESAASRKMAEDFLVRIAISVGNGRETGIHWSSDLTTQYVQFNSEYTT